MAAATNIVSKAPKNLKCDKRHNATSVICNKHNKATNVICDKQKKATELYIRHKRHNFMFHIMYTYEYKFSVYQSICCVRALISLSKGEVRHNHSFPTG